MLLRTGLLSGTLLEGCESLVRGVLEGQRVCGKVGRLAVGNKQATHRAAQIGSLEQCSDAAIQWESGK